MVVGADVVGAGFVGAGLVGAGLVGAGLVGAGFVGAGFVGTGCAVGLPAADQSVTGRTVGRPAQLDGTRPETLKEEPVSYTHLTLPTIYSV